MFNPASAIALQNIATDPFDLGGVQRAFAAAVLDGASPALLIDADNNNAGWVSVDDIDGRCAAGRVAEFVVAADLDCPVSSERFAEELGQLAADRGMVAVVLASGREGHRHVWIRTADAVEYEALCSEIVRLWKSRGLASPLRSGGSLMRPPFAPHRSGVPATLISPVDVGAALEALQPPAPYTRREAGSRSATKKERYVHTVEVIGSSPVSPTKRHDHYQRDEHLPRLTVRRLSPQMQAVLRQGHEAAPGRYVKDDGTPDPSALTRALAVAVWRAGGTVGDLEVLLSDESNKAGAGFRSRRDGTGRWASRAHGLSFARAWLARVWTDDEPDNSVASSVRPTAFVEPSADEAVTDGVAKLRAASKHWTHRGAPYDLLVLDYVCRKALLQNTQTPSASVRELAEHTGLSVSGVRAALKRLEVTGVLQVVRRPRGVVTDRHGEVVSAATIYRLCWGYACTQHTGGTPPSGRPALDRNAVPKAGRLEPGSDAAAAAGARAVQIHNLLLEHGQLSVLQICELTGLADHRALLRPARGSGTAGGALWRLLAAGFVVRSSDGFFWAVDVSDDSADSLLDQKQQRCPQRLVIGRQDAMQARHAEERAAYAEWRADTAPQRCVRQRQAVEVWAAQKRGPAAAKIIGDRWAAKRGLGLEPAIDTRREQRRRPSLRGRATSRRVRDANAHRPTLPGLEPSLGLDPARFVSSGVLAGLGVIGWTEETQVRLQGR